MAFIFVKMWTGWYDAHQDKSRAEPDQMSSGCASGKVRPYFDGTGRSCRRYPGEPVSAEEQSRPGDPVFHARSALQGITLPAWGFDVLRVSAVSRSLTPVAAS